jgi:hypothetical protein
MRIAVLAVFATVIAAAPAAAARDLLDTYYDPVDIQVTWHVDGTATQCFAEEGCIKVDDYTSDASFKSVWPRQFAPEIRFDVPVPAIGGDGRSQHCSGSTTQPEKGTPGGGIQLTSEDGADGKVHVSMPLSCGHFNERLKEIGAPQHIELALSYPLGREIHAVDDGSKEVTGTDGDGSRWTIHESWHVNALYATRCTGMTVSQGATGFKALWGRAPFCLTGSSGRGGYACSLAAAKRGTVSCAGQRVGAPRNVRVCSLATSGDVAQTFGRPVYTHTDGPFKFCFFQGGKGQVETYRGEDEALYRPSAQLVSYAKLLAAKGYAHYKLGRVGGGRLLELVGTRPWVRDWFGYKRGETLWVTSMEGPASLNAKVRRFAGRILSRL